MKRKKKTLTQDLQIEKKYLEKKEEIGETTNFQYPFLNIIAPILYQKFHANIMKILNEEYKINSKTTVN